MHIEPREGDPNDDSQDGPLPSEHEHEGGLAANAEEPDRAGDDRSPSGERPEWVEDLPGADERDRADQDSLEHHVGSEPRHRGDDSQKVVEADAVDRLVPILAAKLEQHLHLPIQLPDADALADLKLKDPQGYKFWMRNLDKQLAHQRFMESAKYRMPLKVIKSAQMWAFLALVAILALAAYALYLDEPWVAGFLVSLDVVAIVGIFAGFGRQGDE